jgi:glycosyltransferase involved in cell wall biosynthesis
MNILYLSADRGIPVRGHKGAAVHVRAITAAFTRAGHDVTIFTPRPGPADGPAPAATIVECPLPGVPASFTDTPAQREEQAQAYTGTLVAAARGWLAENPCDVLYERYSLWSDAGARLRAATGLPLVLEVNAPLRAEAARHRYLNDDVRAAQIEATQFSAADFLAVVSEPLAEYVVSRGADPARVHVLPNGVDPDHFHPAVRGGEVRRRYGLHGHTVIGFAGRMRPWHDGPTLLRAFARLRALDPAYHLLLVGDMSPEMVDAIAGAGLESAVTCTGPVPHADIPQHLAAMDIAVSPHAPADEATFYFSPLKLFEYLACGVPTVAAAVGQPGRLIQPGQNGYLYPPGDDEALAATIHQLAQDPAHAREIAWNGAAMVLQNHTWAQNATRVLDWLAPPAAANAEEPPHALPLLDGRLRQRLYRATRPDLAESLLARRLTAFDKKGPNRLKRVENITILKYKPGRRCVLAYELTGRQHKTGRPVRQQVIGKVFRDERGRRLLDMQALLYAHEFGPNAGDAIHVPQPFGYVPEMRMLVQAHAPGKTLNELSLIGDVLGSVRRCAEGLAKLHRSRALNDACRDGQPLLKPFTLDDELRGLADYTAQLAESCPLAMPQVESLRHGLLEWAARLPLAATAVPLHRDFYYSQVLFDGPRLHLIDFDLMALGDAAVDVANFTAHLVFLGLDQFGDADRFRYESDTFLATYLDHRPVDGAFAQRLAFYQATTFYRLLNVVAPRPGLRHLFTPLLALAQTAVARRLSPEFHLADQLRGIFVPPAVPLSQGGNGENGVHTYKNGPADPALRPQRAG